MTSSDVDDVARLINQLHPDRPGVIRPERVRQGWTAFVARNDEGRAVGFLLGSFIDYGLVHESSGTLEQLVIDESVRGQLIGTELVEHWKSWLIAEGVTLGFASASPDAVGFYEKCGFRRCTGPWLVWAAE